MNELALKVANIVKPEIELEAGSIKFDLSIFNSKVTELIETVKKEKVTIDTIKDYKQLKATLNNFHDEINNEKIRIVREFSKPIDDFTEQVKAN